MNGATAWKPAAASSGSRCRQVWAASGKPCKHSASGPVPASSTTNSTSFARTARRRTAWCPVISALLLLAPSAQAARLSASSIGPCTSEARSRREAADGLSTCVVTTDPRQGPQHAMAGVFGALADPQRARDQGHDSDPSAPGCRAGACRRHRAKTDQPRSDQHSQTRDRGKQSRRVWPWTISPACPPRYAPGQPGTRADADYQGVVLGGVVGERLGDVDVGADDERVDAAEASVCSADDPGSGGGVGGVAVDGEHVW